MKMIFNYPHLKSQEAPFPNFIEENGEEFSSPCCERESCQ